MKKKSLIILTFFIVTYLISGCENITEVSTGLNYKEYVVVRAELNSDKYFKGVSFTRTLPLDEQYDITKAELKNVEAYIKVNNVQIIPLYYTSNGIYSPIDSIRIFTGNTYELFAKVNNTSIYAKTIIPYKPDISSTSFPGEQYLEASVNPKANEVYGAAWGIVNSRDQAPGFQEIVKPENDLSKSVLVRTMDLDSQYKSATYNGKRYIQVYAFDSAYSDFFKTSKNNQKIDDAFSQGGDQIIWNVHGENVIGLFIGVTPGNQEIVN